MTGAVTTRGLTRRFGDTIAVDGLDLDIARGEVFGFLGPNGAGKSTTVRMLTTLLAPSSGEVTVAGCDLSTEAHEIRRRIGVALQEAGLSGRQTGRETLRLQARLQGLRGDVLATRVDAAIEFVDIGDAVDRLVSTYSGGMKRRLDLAASLLHEPSVVFLDEPTTGLDPESRQRVWNQVRRLNHDLGVTIFLTTQYLEEADQLADRVAIINDGRIVADGTPADLKRSVGADTVTIDIPEIRRDDIDFAQSMPCADRVDVDGDRVRVTTDDSTDIVAAIVGHLATDGRTPRRLDVRGPTLDDVFLAATGSHLDTDYTPEPAR